MSAEPTQPDIADSLRLAAYLLQVDVVTAETTAALETEGIDCVLLKGPTTGNWLFRGAEVRGYVDTDLMIRRADWSRSRSVLEGLGFLDDLGPMAHPRMESGAGYPWKRERDDAEVDLHYELFGLGAGPEEIWDAFWSTSLVEKIGGRMVRTPSHAARLLHITTHAVQHGGKRTQSMRDLERALEIVPAESWQEALELAIRLRAQATFVSALSLSTAGRAIAAEIGAPREGEADSLRSALRMEDVPLSEGFAELAETRGLRAKLALILREAIPNRTFMLWWSPLARRGRLGMAAAYCWRLVWLASQAVPGYRSWRRASREHPG